MELVEVAAAIPARSLVRDRVTRHLFPLINPCPEISAKTTSINLAIQRLKPDAEANGGLLNERTGRHRWRLAELVDSQAGQVL
jgi:hypothetical protein